MAVYGNLTVTSESGIIFECDNIIRSVMNINEDFDFYIMEADEETAKKEGFVSKVKTTVKLFIIKIKELVKKLVAKIQQAATMINTSFIKTVWTNGQNSDEKLKGLFKIAIEKNPSIANCNKGISDYETIFLDNIAKTIKYKEKLSKLFSEYTPKIKNMSDAESDVQDFKSDVADYMDADIDDLQKEADLSDAAKCAELIVNNKKDVIAILKGTHITDCRNAVIELESLLSKSLINTGNNIKDDTLKSIKDFNAWQSLTSEVIKMTIDMMKVCTTLSLNQLKCIINLHLEVLKIARNKDAYLNKEMSKSDKKLDKRYDKYGYKEEEEK